MKSIHKIMEVFCFIIKLQFEILCKQINRRKNKKHAEGKIEYNHTISNLHLNYDTVLFSFLIPLCKQLLIFYSYSD